MTGASAVEREWAQRACASVRASLLDVPRWRGWSGLWSTARARYDAVPLPPRFSVQLVETPTAVRRLAVCPGDAPGIVIVPGLFASLDERLFVDIAACAQRRGRAVILVEDRLAALTLALNGPSLPTAPQLADELAFILRRQANPCDVLALSAGALPALHAQAPARRIVAWSPAFAPRAVMEHASKSAFIRRHFQKSAERAFAATRSAPPSWLQLVTALMRQGCSALTSTPMFLVHVADDPVAPVAEVHRLAGTLHDAQSACVVSRGGHLGFGALLGVDAYLRPFFP